MYTNGGVYDGDWKHDLRDGFGTSLYASGNTYVGKYKDDQRDGQGKLVFAADGRVQEGQWMGLEFLGSGLKL